MALSDEERQQLEALMNKDKEPEADEDFEVFIQDGKTGNIVRVPYSRAKGLLKRMGLDLEELAPEGEGEEGEEGDEEILDEGAPKGRKGYWKSK